MPYPRRLLIEDEDVVIDQRPHWCRLVRPLAIASIALAGAIAGFVLWHKAPVWFAWVLLAVVVGDALYTGGRVLQWRSTHFVVTTRRVIFRAGVLRRFGREILLDSLQDVAFQQGILQRIIGAGDLIVQASGERDGYPFRYIRQPERAQSIINRTRQDLLRRWQVPVQQAFHLEQVAHPADHLDQAAYPEPGVCSQGSEVAGQIERLEELHRRGVITDLEFEEKRVELLGRL